MALKFYFLSLKFQFYILWGVANSIRISSHDLNGSQFQNSDLSPTLVQRQYYSICMITALLEVNNLWSRPTAAYEPAQSLTFTSLQAAALHYYTAVLPLTLQVLHRNNREGETDKRREREGERECHGR